MRVGWRPWRPEALSPSMEGEWAYCAAGARTQCVWAAIEPVTLTNLKLIAVVRPPEVVPEDSPR
jgi:hypothetical protein